MNKLIERSYAAIKQRGLINSKTSVLDFIEKIDEEHEEVREALFETKDRYAEELTDLATVCFMQLKHMGRNPIKEFEKVVLKNEKRANESR